MLRRVVARLERFFSTSVRFEFLASLGPELGVAVRALSLHHQSHEAMPDAKKWIEFCLSLNVAGQRSAYEFAVELKSEQKIIGGVSLNRISSVHGTAGGGIWMNSRYQGHGYGSEAFGEKIRFAFEELKLRRLENGFFKGNEASLLMQQRFGFKLEGEKRSAYLCMADGQLKNECITGLLREEWIKPNK